MYFHLTTRIGELGGMVLSNQELCRLILGGSSLFKFTKYLFFTVGGSEEM
jgi:hypothetical protein